MLLLINRSYFLEMNSTKLFQIPSFSQPSPDYFRTVIQSQRKPAVLKNIQIGGCQEKWNPEYLMGKIGPDRTVTVHESSSNRLRFLNKNFTYKLMSFGDFIRKASADDCSEGKHYYYYRAVAEEDPRKNPSDFRRDFPSLTPDFILPNIVDPANIFSCVFRCGSADLGLWLHHDVMDNILVQISGRKRAILFNPEDTDFLYLEGDKSLIHDPENVDPEKYPLFSKATQYSCTMEAGDILFIPAFWMHYMVSEEFSVAVNLFWYNLPKDLYDSKDIYGNKEMLPFSRAAQGVDRAVKQLELLPEDIRRFYLRMLIRKIDVHLQKPSC